MPDPTPEILRLSNRYRDQLLRRERAAATRMVHYYGTTWGKLQPQIKKLQVEVDLLRDAGEDITPGKLWRLDRMKAIQRQASQQLDKFVPFAERTVKDTKREAIAAAQRDAPAIVRGTYPADMPIKINFATMPRAAVEQMVGFLADGSPLRGVISKYTKSAVNDFGDTLVTSLAMGWGPRRTARALRSAYGMGLTDALRLARTEQMRAYRESTRQSYLSSDVVKEWERLVAVDDHTCMACIMLDGKRYPLSEPMDDHVQGRCTMLPITKTYHEMGVDVDEPDFSREMAQDWFLRQDADTQEKMMGKGMHAAWKAGVFKLEDIPKLIRSDVWGNSWVPRSLRDLVGEAGASQATLFEMARMSTEAEIERTASLFVFGEGKEWTAEEKAIAQKALADLQQLGPYRDIKGLVRISGQDEYVAYSLGDGRVMVGDMFFDPRYQNILDRSFGGRPGVLAHELGHELAERMTEEQSRAYSGLFVDTKEWWRGNYNKAGIKADYSNQDEVTLRYWPSYQAMNGWQEDLAESYRIYVGAGGEMGELGERRNLIAGILGGED